MEAQQSAYNPYYATATEAAVDPFGGKQVDYSMAPPQYQQQLGGPSPYDAGIPPASTTPHQHVFVDPYESEVDPYGGKQADYSMAPQQYQQPFGGPSPFDAEIPPASTTPHQHVFDAQTPTINYGAGQTTPPNQYVAPVVTDYQFESARPEEDTFKFTEKSIRLGFIKKVFSLLFFQLLLTAGLMSIFIFVEPVKDYVTHNDWVYITSICLTILFTIVFGFVTKLRKMWPVNLICLLIITLVMSTMLGSIACTMEVDEILISVGIVIAVVAVCAILGFQKKFDFTPMVGLVSMFGMCLFAFGFLCIFFYSEVLTVVYCTLGALLFALWLLMDIQLILGGKHKLQFDPEDYIGGALSLYVDIIYMLMMIFFIFKAT